MPILFYLNYFALFHSFLSLYLLYFILCYHIQFLFILFYLSQIYLFMSFHEYQPSGEWGTCSPPATPAKSKMATIVPQNGLWGLERGLTLGYWALQATFVT